MVPLVVVTQVHWKPSYDVHIAMTGNVPPPTVKLDFRCTVMQWTGEIWENISLALTTATQVSQLIQLPEPKKINISLGPTNVFQPTADTWTERDRDREIRTRAVGRQCSLIAKIEAASQHPPPSVPPAPSVDSESDVPSQTVSQLISHVCIVRHATSSETSLALSRLWNSRIARIRSRISRMEVYLSLLTMLNIMYWLPRSPSRRSSCVSWCPVSTPASITQCVAFSPSFSYAYTTRLSARSRTPASISSFQALSRPI